MIEWLFVYVRCTSRLVHVLSPDLRLHSRTDRSDQWRGDTGLENLFYLLKQHDEQHTSK